MNREKNDNREKFQYSYSVPTELERREIASIKKLYEDETPKDSKLSRLRKLDAFVKNSAMALGISSGTIGLLIFGLGMSLFLEWSLYAWGVLMAILGILPMIAAYPAYKFLLNKNKKKYGAEILRLSEELLSEDAGRA